MEQALLVFAIAILVWVGAGIGRQTRPIARNAFTRQEPQAGSQVPRQAGSPSRIGTRAPQND